MKKLRLLGVALAATFVLTAVAATAAFAENPEITPTPAGFPILFTGTGGAGQLVSNAGSITSTSSKVSGEFTSAKLGKVSIDFLVAKSGGVSCNSVGDEKGTILVPNADAHLVDILPSGVLALGLAVTPASNVTIKCGTLAIEVKGTAIGQVNGVTSGATIPLGTAKAVAFKATTAGSVTQLLKTCDQDKTFCEGKTYSLLAEFGTGFKEASQEATAEVSFNRTVSVSF